MDRILKILQKMETIVKSEPQAVLTFNKFVADCKDVQKELRISMQNFAELEFHLMSFQAIYMQYLEGMI